MNSSQTGQDEPVDTDTPQVEPCRRDLESAKRVLEQLVDAVVVTDETDAIVFFNFAAEKLWGWSRKEVLGRPISILAPESARLGSPFVEAFREDGSRGFSGIIREFRIRKRDGSLTWARLSLSRLGLDGQALHVGFLHDISHEYESRERMRLLSLGADHAANAILIADEELRVVYVNAEFERIFGTSAEDAVGSRVPDLLLAPADSGSAFCERLQQSMRQPAQIQVDEMLYNRNLHPLWMSITASPVLDEAGRLRNVVLMLTDITATKIYETLQSSVLENMARNRPVHEALTLLCQRIEEMEPLWRMAVFMTSEDGLALNLLAAPSLPAEFHEAVRDMKVSPESSISGRAAWLGQDIHEDMEIHPVPQTQPVLHALAEKFNISTVWASPVKDTEGHILGVLTCYIRSGCVRGDLHSRLVDMCVSLCAVAIARENYMRRIERMAYYDALTGLPNRARLALQLDSALKQSQREGNYVAALSVNLDRFKQVNDTLGREAGNALLREAAQRIAAILPADAMACRVSGDEFAVALPYSSAEHAGHLAQKILDALARPLVLPQGVHRLTASVGISLAPFDGDGAEALLGNADVAMNQAKQDGRNTLRFFASEMSTHARARLGLENALREAIQNGELTLHYQPQISLTSGELRGMEALARWRHPELGNVPPSQFIPLAEEIGLIEELGHNVLEMACAQLAAWRAGGMWIPSVSVNLSSRHFRNTALPRLITDVLSWHGLDPASLTLEVTENMVMDTQPATLQSLRAIHALGVRLAVDDFGTGYSNLGYLRRLPLQELKLDRSFVHDIATDGKTRALIMAIIQIARSLGMVVVGEGIETEVEMQYLRRKGCHVGQGYLLAQPMPVPEFEDWYAARRPGHPQGGEGDLQFSDAPPQ